jgi:hypothetical protein
LGVQRRGTGPDPTDPVFEDIPVKIEIGGRVFEIEVDSEFFFSRDGLRGRGSGEME